MTQSSRNAASGLWQGLGAYAIWGLLPVYFHSLGHVAAVEIVGARILWSMLFVVGLLAVRQQLGALAATMTTWRLALPLALSGLLIGANWSVYMWSVTRGHVLAASLGYFLNPLFNVLIGVFLLRERLSAIQAGSVALAAIGVAVVAFAAPDSLGLALALAISFAVYGLVRKLTPVNAVIGLGVETLFLAPLAAAALFWFAWREPLASIHDGHASLILAGSGVVTSVPLFLFAAAARKLPMVTMGLIQFLTPTILFLVGALLYGEPMSLMNWISFAFIWSGVALFIMDALLRQRAGAQANAVASKRSGSPGA